MPTVTYNLSTKIKLTISEIERTRVKILLYPLPFEKENKLKWEADISRAYWSLVITGNKLNRKRIASLLSSPFSYKTQSTEERDILRYRQALEYIYYNWYGSDKSLNYNVVAYLYKIACQPTDTIKFVSTRAKTDLIKTLEYLNRSNEHPIIQAGIALMQMRTLSPFENYNGIVSRLVSQLYLYKGGYDFRGLLILDEFWHKDMDNYRRLVNTARQTQNLTNWLEYYIEAINIQLVKALNNMRSSRSHEWIDNHFWSLNERQKEILSMLKDPTATLTNRRVQRIFKISQITASRDLSKLAKLRLLLSHSKGRSTFYTKV
ncbi:MAG: hypothetical protein UV74_C0002G0009 [Candidatus Woesebacteria bacterium GW2011_GWB1_43_14]|uniref:Fido domain-containing protein n=1 Tax=Candidatus Woesebacteria bacterium GW2011_GWB1_43_14 TaxID=1618578 RepID=A0A0G1DLQ1_9BACT|nr:MAG: hypothetical protein UV51_C0004G0056 [Candidatus Woesebacteria bacterium GW2011_GWC1_42_9]KKS98790.1 MAG: hypothetical protein UV74_C0002G0009 [Candidatus Woesebacteria bacterium GW2011_GWB1_43_14]